MNKLGGVALFILLFILAACSSGESTEAPAAAEEPLAAEEPAAEEAPVEALAEIGPAIFSIEDTLPFTPIDIIKEIGYYHGTGPGICDRMMIEATPLEVEVCPRNTVEQMGYLSLMLSGLEGGEAVDLTITGPDESLSSEELDANRRGAVSYEFIPGLDDPPGEYSFNFKTSQGDFDKTVRVVPPRGPRLFLVPDQRTLILHNFSPMEHVRLFLYEVSPGSDPEMLGWEEYQADARGNLTIEYTALEEPDFYAIGETSGLVPYSLIGASHTSDSWAGGDIACPEAPPPLQLDFDSEATITAARVVAEVESYPDVFSFPLPRGTRLRLIPHSSAPRCSDGAIWWAVACPQLEGLECKGFTRVWVPEGREDTYYIQPGNQ